MEIIENMSNRMSREILKKEELGDLMNVKNIEDNEEYVGVDFELATKEERLKMISEEETKLDQWDNEEHRRNNHMLRNNRDEQGQEEWMERKENLISARKKLIERRKKHLDDD